MNSALTLKEALDLFDSFVINKPGCPFCVRAIRLLEDYNVQFKVLDYLEHEALDREITKAQNHKTYPKIYLHKKWLGGYTNLFEYFKKEDKSLL